MQLLTAAQMRAVDADAIEQRGIPGIVLMENAGLRVVEFIESTFASLPGLRVVIAAGKGNNGGDGLVIARHLLQSGADVEVCLAAEGSELRGDAAINLRIVESMSAPVTALTGRFPRRRLTTALQQADLIVDALLGTGIRGGARGLAARVIECINEASTPVVAVDAPSGIDADSGAVEGPAVDAEWTVTLGAPKVGLFVTPAAAYAGEVWVGDIGICREWMPEDAAAWLIDANTAARWLPSRPPDAHKGTFGRVLVVGGSVGMVGAVVLAGRAALRGGAGLTTVATPRSCLTSLAAALVEATSRPLAETECGSLAEPAIDEVRDLVESADAVALGPGLSRHPASQAFARRLVQQLQQPAVIDADGLVAFVDHVDALQSCPAQLVLTPHPGEAAQLLGTTPARVQNDRLAAVRQLTEASGAVVVLKGAGSIVQAPGCPPWINPTGNPGMATGGSGDVLTGLIAALLAQGLPALRAAALGVHLHGLAGDLAAGETGSAALIAGDLTDHLGAAMRRLSSLSNSATVTGRLVRAE